MRGFDCVGKPLKALLYRGGIRECGQIISAWEIEDKLKTIELLSQLATPYSLNIYSLQFFPGTTLYEQALKEDIIDSSTPLQHYVTHKPTYLNLITVLFGLFRIPQWLLKILLSIRMCIPIPPM